MKVLSVFSVFLLAQVALGGTLQVRGRINPEAENYIRVAAPGELSPDIEIRVLGPGEDRYSPCRRVKGALCEVYVENGSGKSKIVIEADGYEPYDVDVPRLAFSERNVTSYNIGTIRLKEAARPRLVQILAGNSTPANYRWSLIVRNPARQPFSIREISLAANKPQLFTRVCDSQRSESFKFSQKLRVTGGAGEPKSASWDLMQVPAATESFVQVTGYMGFYHCGDQMLNIKVPTAISLPGELMTTIQVEMPAAFEVERPGVIVEPGHRPAEPLQVEPGRFESFSFRLTAVRNDVSGQISVTEELKREYSLPRRRPYR